MDGTRSARGEVSPTLRRHLGHVKACEESGETLKAYAQRRGLSVQALYEAKRRARQSGLLPMHRGSASKAIPSKRIPQPRFVEAVRVPEIRELGPAWRLRFAGGEVLESTTRLDFEEVLRVAALLRSRP